MPQLHPTRRTGRRLLTASAIATVAVLGTPAPASASPVTDVQQRAEEGVENLAPEDETAPDETAPDDTEDDAAPTDPLQAGAQCFVTAGEELQLVLEDGTGSLLDGLTGLRDQLEGALEDPQGSLSPEAIEEAAAAGQEQVVATVEVIVDGVTRVVHIVVELGECLAALIPTELPSGPPADDAPPVVPAVPAPQPAETTTPAPAPVQAVAYPGYAPTGGEPTDDGAPVALLGLGLLTAATGGGALWLRARRGVA